MREKLVTIQIVDHLEAIPNADKIEVCVMKGLGWKVIVKKGEIKPKDKVVFFEIDSALPINDKRFEFLRDSSYKRFVVKNETVKECFRLKTRKLRGVISQGLVLPIDDFPEIKNLSVGDDVTKQLNVEHYDELDDLYGRCKSSGGGHTTTGNIKGSFPSFLRKSDQERIENLMQYFEDCKNVKFTAEAKYDGSSLTIYMVDKKYDEDQFGVCSRNNNLKRPCMNKKDCIKEVLSIKKEKCFPFNPIKRFFFKAKKICFILLGKEYNRNYSDYWNVVNNLGIEENCRKYFNKTGRSIEIQGEMVGPGVNGNRDKYDKHHLFVFDVFDVDKQTYLDAKERHEIINEINSLGEHKFEEVDTIKDNWEVFNEITNLDDLRKFVDRKTLRGNPLEGVVFKSINKTPYFSFKCINVKYLLSEKD